MDDQQSETDSSIGPQKSSDPKQANDRDQFVEPMAAFEELSKLVLGEQSLTAVLQRVAELAKAVIPDTREVSVTLMKDDQDPETVVFTGSLADQLDERQYEAGFGPCMDAALSGRTIPVTNTDPNSPYPDFSRVALQSGVSHSLSVGMPVPRRIVGALNLYATGELAFDGQAVEVAETFAGYAAVAIANASLYSSTAGLADQMQAAMRSRSTIEQAKGILMGRNHCTADEAFAILANMSQRRNEKLGRIAHEIVDRAAEK